MSEMMELPNATLSTTSLVIKEGIPYEEWENIGKQLGRVNQGLLWWIGDWVNFGERSYGEKYAQAMDSTGKAYGTIKNAAYLSRKFPQNVRREGLTFSHYGVIAGMPDDISDRLLDLAEQHSWTVGELKNQRIELEDQSGVKPKKEKMITCPGCGVEFALA